MNFEKKANVFTWVNGCLCVECEVFGSMYIK